MWGFLGTCCRQCDLAVRSRGCKDQLLPQPLDLALPFLGDNTDQGETLTVK